MYHAQQPFPAAACRRKPAWLFAGHVWDIIPDNCTQVNTFLQICSYFPERAWCGGRIPGRASLRAFLIGACFARPRNGPRPFPTPTEAVRTSIPLPEIQVQTEAQRQRVRFGEGGARKRCGRRRISRRSKSGLCPNDVGASCARPRATPGRSLCLPKRSAPAFRCRKYRSKPKPSGSGFGLGKEGQGSGADGGGSAAGARADLASTM